MRQHDTHKPVMHELGTDGRDRLTQEEKHGAVQFIGSLLRGEADSRGLELIRDGALGASDSAHDVFFARGIANRSKGFALKRFRRIESGQQELDSLYEAKRRGFETIEPVGEGLYHVSDAIGAILVTKRIPNLTTMNQIGWADHYSGQPGYERLSSTLRRTAGHVGRMHRMGMISGDLQLKNVGTTPSGHFIVYDTESAVFFDPKPQDPTEKLQFDGQCLDDVVRLVASLASRGFLAGSSDKVFEDEVQDHFLMPYVEVSGSEYILETASYDRVRERAILPRRELSSPHVGMIAMAGQQRQN